MVEKQSKEHKMCYISYRSEVHNPMSRLRFAPLIEAYCLYCGSYLLDSLYKEVKSLNEYRTFSKKTNRDSSLVSFQLHDFSSIRMSQKMFCC
jgi:hypothetical protein